MNPSPARVEANRANAQHSTGPTSAEGKAKSSMNAVKTGLTGRAVLLTAEDAVAYQAHLDRTYRDLAPATDREHALVQMIADNDWRLLSIHPLEAGIRALGRLALAEQVADEPDPDQRKVMLEGKVQLAYRKEFDNLRLQERRLRSYLQADHAELECLQKTRREKEAEELKSAEPLYEAAKAQGLPFDPAFFGFVFSTERFEAHLNRHPPTIEAYIAHCKARSAAA
jgi:hypothetical protein